MRSLARVGVVCVIGAWCLGAPLTSAAKGPARVSNTPSDVHHYVLHPVGDGTYDYQSPGFTASVAADGTVTFHEPTLTPRSRLQEIITGQGQGRRAEDWPVTLPSEYLPTPYDDRERQLEFDHPRPQLLPVAAPIFIDDGFKMDVTDVFARGHHQDPYQTAKASFLSDTFDFRMKLAAQQHRQAAGAALAGLANELDAIWQDGRFSASERSRIVYLLWQETSDDAIGLRARDLIQAFADKHLPPDQAAWFAPPRPLDE
jgi:hypothetical protein